MAAAPTPTPAPARPPVRRPPAPRRPMTAAAMRQRPIPARFPAAPTTGRYRRPGRAKAPAAAMPARRVSPTPTTAPAAAATRPRRAARRGRAAHRFILMHVMDHRMWPPTRHATQEVPLWERALGRQQPPNTFVVLDHLMIASLMASLA